MITPLSLGAAHATRVHPARPYESLAWVVALLVIGALLVFDVGGIATARRENSRVALPWGPWVREHHDPPDPATFVGWGFFLFGAFSTVYFLFAVLAPGTPTAPLVTLGVCALLGVFGLWLVPEIWRGPSGRRPPQSRASRLVRLRFAALRWLDGDPREQGRARGFVPLLAGWWGSLITIGLGMGWAQLDGAAALAVLTYASGATALLSIMFTVTAIADVWPSFVVPPHLRHLPHLPGR